MNFCVEIKTKVSEQIKQTDNLCKNETPEPEYEAITKTLDDNQVSRKKNIYCKNKKFYRLKYQPNQPSQPVRTERAPSLDDEEIQPATRSFRRDQISKPTETNFCTSSEGQRKRTNQRRTPLDNIFMIYELDHKLNSKT